MHRNDATLEHIFALESENISGQTFAPGQLVNANFTWQIPFSENFTAIYKGNIFGSWDQNNEIAQFHDGLTPAKGVSQYENFSFYAPITPGRYAIRIIFNASYSFATSFTNYTHYKVDLVFQVQ